MVLFARAGDGALAQWAPQGSSADSCSQPFAFAAAIAVMIVLAADRERVIRSCQQEGITLLMATPASPTSSDGFGQTLSAAN